VKPPVSNRDLVLLSQYLDQQLNPAQRARLEARLSQEADLRETLETLRKTRMVLRSMPRARAPRNFTLTEQRIPARVSPLVPYLSWASAVATLLLALILMGDWLGFWLPARQAAPAVSYSQEIAVETPAGQPQALMEPSVRATSTELATLTDENTARSLEVQQDAPTEVVSAPAPAESAQMKEAPQAEAEAFKSAPAVTMPESTVGLGVSPVISGTETMTTTTILEMEAPVEPTPATPLAQAVLPTSAATEGAYEAESQVKAEDQALSAVSTPPALAGEETLAEAPVQETSDLQGSIGRWVLWIIEALLLLVALAAALAALILRQKSAQ